MDTRRLAQVAPIAVVAATFAFWLSNGCGWEYEVAATTSESGGETIEEETSTSDDGTDTSATDTPYTLPDGRICTGHDEDGDGVPDECDNCPNVANPTQGGAAIGSACAPGSDFIPSPTRLLFDPFRSLSSWKASGTGAGVFDMGPDMDSVVGGSTAVSECETVAPMRCPLWFLLGTTGAGSSSIVATTTFSVDDEANGSAGLMLRANGDPKKFYLCALSIVNGFAVARAPDTGCNGGFCAPITFTMPTDAGAMAAQFPIPSEIPHKPGDVIGLRASVTASMGDGGILGDFECRVFDPKKPESLTSTDPLYRIKITAGGTRWFPTGEVGVYAQRSRANFRSIDVLRGP